MNNFDKKAVLNKLYIALGIVLLLLVVTGIVFAIRYIIGGKETPKDPPETSASESEKPEETTAGESETEEPKPDYDDIVLTFVGDCMLASKYKAKGMWYFNDYAKTMTPDYFFKNVQPYFANDDFTIANCENVFTKDNLSPIAKSSDPAYWYKSDPAYAEFFKVGSVEILSVANNHTGDFGKQGEKDTKDALEAQGLVWGDEEHPVILEKYGIKIGIYMCNMFGTYQMKPILEWLAQAEGETDYQIIYFHGGTERVYQPDAWKEKACHQLVDAGADLIIGGHPHVLQPLEEYNGVEIIYSMGNFLFGGAHQTDNRTIIYQKTLRIKNGEIIDQFSDIVPCYEYISYDYIWQPTPMEEGTPEYEKILSFMRGEASKPK